MTREPIYGIAILFLLALSAGCASTSRQVRLPPQRALGAGYATVLAGVSEDESISLPAGPFSLDRALALAMRHNPELESISCDVRAAEALRRQAGRRPNPVLELDVGEYDRGGAGFESSETGVSLGQAIELGGKRRWRSRAAEAEEELAGWEYERLRLEVFNRTRVRFIAALAAQRALALAEVTTTLVEQTRDAVVERVKAGKEPPLQESKADAAVELARLDRLEAANRLDEARLALAAMWGASTAAFETVEGELDATRATVPALESLRGHLKSNPVLARWDAALRWRRAELGAQKAARIPDLETRVGYTQFEEDNTHAFAVGVGMALPLFDRNQGGVTAAELAVARAETERRAAETELAGALAQAHAELVLAHRRVAVLRDRVVPAMQRAFEAAVEGYREGKFGLLEMLDAQRGLFEAQGEEVDALLKYHMAVTRTEGLIGLELEGE